MKLKNIVLEQDSNFDKNRTSDELSTPNNKLNVLFIGDGDTAFESSYAKQILNSRIVNGDIISTDGDIAKLFRLLQSNLSDQYDVVSLMFSNIKPNDKLNSIDVLKAMYSSIKSVGSTLITISPPTKEFAPYRLVKWQNNETIANWMNITPISDFNIDAYDLTDDKIYFQKNKTFLNKEGHLLIAKIWIKYIKTIDPEIEADIIDKNKKLKQNQGQSDEKRIFKKGDTDPKIKILQDRLIELGFDINRSEVKSGLFGQSTYDAVRMFQLLNELPVTGYIDNNVMNALSKKDAKPFQTKKPLSLFQQIFGNDLESPLLAIEPEVEPLAPEGGAVIDSETSQAVTTKFGFPEADLNFYKKILNDLNVPITTQNLLFFAAWRVGEFGTSGKGTTGVGCTNNPFATTYNLKKDPGQTVFNSAGVKNYTKPEYGIEAIVKTLKLGYYTAIVQGLKDDVGALELAYRLEKSPWGTQHTSDILKSYKTIYASKIAGNPGSTALVTFTVEPSTTTTATTTSLDSKSLPTGKNGQLADSELSYINKSDGTPHPSARLANIVVKYYNAMVAAAKKDGINIDVSGDDSAYRRLGSSAEGCSKGFSQWCAWQKFQAGTGKLAAKPGTSNHGLGLTVDINLSKQGRSSKVYKWLANNANKYGFYETVSSEPWHWDFKYNKVSINLSPTTTTSDTKDISVSKSIVIGDSLAPWISKASGIPVITELQKGGIPVQNLLLLANAYKNIDPTVSNVIISIGTNGIYSRSTSTITQLISRLHTLFPNAKLLVVKGTYGPKATWQPLLTKVSQKTVDAYYADFSANGAIIISTPIGNQVDAHGPLPVYKTIAGEIRSKLKGATTISSKNTTAKPKNAFLDKIPSWVKFD